MRIGFVGAPSTGKSTLSLELSRQLKLRGEPSTIISEFATEYFSSSIPYATLRDQLLIMETQIAREQNIPINKWVVSECPAFLNFVYLLLGYSDDRSDLSLFAKYLKSSIKSLNYYDLIFYLPPEFKQVPSEIRIYNEDDRAKIDWLLRDFLIAFGNSKSFVLIGDFYTRCEIMSKVVFKA